MAKKKYKNLEKDPTKLYCLGSFYDNPLKVFKKKFDNINILLKELSDFCIIEPGKESNKGEGGNHIVVCQEDYTSKKRLDIFGFNWHRRWRRGELSKGSFYYMPNYLIKKFDNIKEIKTSRSDGDDNFNIIKTKTGSVFTFNDHFYSSDWETIPRSFMKRKALRSFLSRDGREIGRLVACGGSEDLEKAYGFYYSKLGKH